MAVEIFTRATPGSSLVLYKKGHRKMKLVARANFFQYASNTKVYQISFKLTDHQLELGRWGEVANLDEFAVNCPDYALYTVIPTRVTLPSFKLSKNKLAHQTFNTTAFPKFSVSGFRM